MSESEINTLTDELIDAKAELTELEGKYFALHDDVRSWELSWMQLKEEYSELARAIGMPSDSFYGDPLVEHTDVMARAKELAGFARAA